HSPKASFLGRWAAFFCGCKDIVYTVHGWPFHKFMPLVSYYFYLFLEKITSKITKKIIVVSNYDLREGIRKIAPKGKFVLIHYGIDTTPLEEIYEKRKKRIQKDNLIITVSALKPQKGLDYFLNMAKDVLNEFPYIKFWIIGNGPLKKKIKRKIKRMHLENSVFLKGWVKDLSKAYQEATLFVLTSLWEGLPLAVIEAVICGIPILASNTGGLLDIVKEEKQGKIVDLKELPHFGRKCKKILQNYAQWNKMVKSERKKIDVKYWEERRMLEEINKLYAEF
ncbi:MAG: glycosyltransferase, partial [Candidatus Omnitrophica bacterium]|nr:glycosyltransferase [Candidatus Omnitrophota bacterium]